MVTVTGSTEGSAAGRRPLLCDSRGTLEEQFSQMASELVTPLFYWTGSLMFTVKRVDPLAQCQHISFLDVTGKLLDRKHLIYKFPFS